MKKKLLTLMLTAAMILGLSACGSEGSGNSGNRIKELEDQIAELEAEKEELGQQLGVAGESNETQQPVDSETAQLLKKAAGIDDSNAEDWGACGADLTWYFSNDILVIRGTGDMTDNPWIDEHYDDINWVIFEDGCTSICENAFCDYDNFFPGHYCENLSKVILPNTLTTIGPEAFNNCSSLTGVTIPDSVTRIDDAAFSDTGITSVIIPDSVTYLSGFDGTGITSIEIPDSVTEIGEDAFRSCSSLTSVTIPDSVTRIGEDAFAYTGITSVTIPDSVTYLSGFADTGITSIEIPDSVTEIGGNAFYECSNLTSVEMPNVTKIGGNAFQECSSLTSVEMPNVTTIGDNAFEECSSLTSVEMPNVTKIGYIAFYKCSNLTSVKMPNVVELDWSVFNGCSSLTSVEMPNATEVDGAYDAFYGSSYQPESQW